MPLPPALLQAACAKGGGKLALVLGAGCSVEAPTNIPVSSVCSREVHRQLVADGILLEGECEHPEDLSALADVVFNKLNSQREVVERFRNEYDLKFATPNDGHWIAAALLFEGIVSSILTLNYDLALSNAIAGLGAGKTVGVVECPEQLPDQKTVNLYYLHRNVNALNPDSWILRTAALDVEWQGHWEPIIANRVLTTPVVLFAGLGTPVAVLLESTRLLQAALPGKALFLADPGDRTTSGFFQAVGLDDSRYIPLAWGALMEELSKRLLKEQIDRLGHAVTKKISEDHIQHEDVASLFVRLQNMGFVRAGKLRATWLLHDKPYKVFEDGLLGLLADILLAIATMARVSQADAVIMEDGLVEFRRTDRIVATFVVASGAGHRSKIAVETRVLERRGKYMYSPKAVLVSGTSDVWTTQSTPPKDILLGDAATDDIIGGPSVFPFFHIGELRQNHDLIREVIP